MPEPESSEKAAEFMSVMASSFSFASGMLAVLLVFVIGGIEAQSDYDTDISDIGSSGSSGSSGSGVGGSAQKPQVEAPWWTILTPNGCRAKGFSATTVNSGQKVCRNRLIFLDQFNELDSTKWQADVQISDEPDYEFTVYGKDPANLFFVRGLLHIRASLLEDKHGQDFVMTGSLDLPECTSIDRSKCSHRAESFDILPPVQSARITSKKGLSFRYGTVDIRARLPSGDWLYPIISLRPTTSVYGPNYASGEIRFPYAVGNRRYHQQMMAGIVLQPPQSRGEAAFFSVNYTNTNASVNYQRQFHIYRINWTPDGFEFFIDSISIGTLIPPDGGWAAAFTDGNTAAWLTGTTMAPFDQEFYVSIGLAAGGVSRFPDGSTFPRKPWMNTSPKAMLNFWKSRDKWQQSWDNPRIELAYVKIRAAD